MSWNVKKVYRKNKNCHETWHGKVYELKPTLKTEAPETRKGKNARRNGGGGEDHGMVSYVARSIDGLLVCLKPVCRIRYFFPFLLLYDRHLYFRGNDETKSQQKNCRYSRRLEGITVRLCRQFLFQPMIIAQPKAENWLEGGAYRYFLTAYYHTILLYNCTRT